MPAPLLFQRRLATHTCVSLSLELCLAPQCILEICLSLPESLIIPRSAECRVLLFDFLIYLFLLCVFLQNIVVPR